MNTSDQSNVENTGQPYRGQINFLLVALCGLYSLLMIGYVVYLGVVGLQHDWLFFNLVELFPLAFMIVVFWVTKLVAPRKKRK